MAQRTKYHHGDLRGALVDAIGTLIERDGPDGFRIAEACRMAGVSTAAPYKHFADRDEMLRAVALGGMARLREAMKAAAESAPAGDAARLAALGLSYVDFARREPGVFRLMFGLAAHHEDDPDLKASGEAARAIVSDVVGGHMRLPPDDPGVALRAYALWCFVHGHCFLTLDGKTEPHEQNIEAQLLALVGPALVPAPADAR